MFRKLQSDLKYSAWGCTSSDMTSEDEIAQVERVLHNKQEQLKDMQYELNLIKQERLSVYKRNVWYFISDFIPNASKWHSALKTGIINGNKLDKRKKYDEKDSYNMLLSWMKKHLGCDDIEITSFIIYGYGHTADEIKFNALGHKWELTIPRVNNVGSRELNDYGQYAFMISLANRDRSHISENVFSTFNEDEMAELFEKNRTKFMEKENKNV